MTQEERETIRSPSGWRAALLIAPLVTAFALVPFDPHDTEAVRGSTDAARYAPTHPEPTHAPHETARADHPDLLVVPDNLEWAPLLAAPVARQYWHQEGSPPILLALPREPGNSLQTLMRELRPRESLQIGVIEAVCDGSVSTERLTIATEPYAAAVTIAKRFWKTVSEVIVAPLDRPSLLILGSALASHAGVPFIPLESGAEKRLFLDLAEHGLARVILLSDSREGLSESDLRDDRFEITPVDRQEAERRLIGTIGAENVNNVVLARVPEQSAYEAGAATWFAPYMSLVRKAPIVLVRSHDGAHAEDRVRQLIETFSLRPRTVTILGDDDAIGVISVTSERLGDYSVEIDPCSGSGRGGVAAYGVGRIPWKDRSRASLLFARGLVWQSRMASQLPSVFMIANPKNEYGPLPLCETISRAAAEEFKNKGATVVESYGEDLTNPQIAAAASTANLVFFHGHMTDLLLFGMPEEPAFEEWQLEDVEAEWESTPWDEPLFPDEEEFHNTAHTNDLRSEFADEVCRFLKEPQFDAVPDFYPADDIEDQVVVPQVQDLSGAPVVFLQSCHSLPGLGPRVLGLGAVGVIGSTTNIHSASGSAMAKAFGDSMLYHGSTLGEALRDARNYFLCLLDLKESRGHRELAKVYRVALSFRLLGDPELAFAALAASKPRRRPVSSRLYRTGRIALKMPARRIPKIETENYLVRMFPGSQLAGIVKRLKHRQVRRILPLYYARLPIREDTPVLRGSASRDATIRIDPHGRFVYVLSLPDRLAPKEMLKIRRDATPARRLQRI